VQFCMLGGLVVFRNVLKLVGMAAQRLYTVGNAASLGWSVEVKLFTTVNICRPGYRSRYSDSLRLDGWTAGLSGDRIRVGARFSAPVQTGPEPHPLMQWVLEHSRVKAARTWR